MSTVPRSIRFGHHALAVLASAMATATIFSLLWGAGLAVAMGGRLPGVAWLMMLAMLCWLGVFIVALPATSIVMTLIFPVTRRRTVPAHAACLIAGGAVGLLLAPLSSSGWHGATPRQCLLFAATGLLTAAIYIVIAGRLDDAGRRPPATTHEA